MNLFLLVKSGQIFPPNKNPTMDEALLVGGDAHLLLDLVLDGASIESDGSTARVSTLPVIVFAKSCIPGDIGEVGDIAEQELERWPRRGREDAADEEVAGDEVAGRLRLAHIAFQ